MIERGGLKPHDDFAATGARVSHVLQAKGIARADLAEDDGSHRGKLPILG